MSNKNHTYDENLKEDKEEALDLSNLTLEELEAIYYILE